jgi:nucleoside-diphosphate-sugar epimerase
MELSKKNSMSKILVIGGSGFLGAALFRSTLAMPSAEVYCADLVPPVEKEVTFIKTNLLSGHEVLDLSRIGFDFIVNCSGQVTNPINLCYQLNTSAMTHILQLVSATGAHFIHISSASVYGPAEAANEETPFNPETPYSCCKAFAEYQITTSLDPQTYTLLRLSNLYGQQQKKGVMSYLFRSLASDRKLYFNNNGSLVRYFLHTDDCAAVIRKVMSEKPVHGIYNLAGPDRFTLKELIALVEHQANVKFESFFEAIAPYDNTLTIDSRKINSALPFEFRYTLEKFVHDELKQHGY